MEEQWQPARASWEERFQAQNEEFIKANLWQREAMEIRVNSQDGFLVLIGLFVVLVLENLWSLDPDEFASKEKLEVFLILLVCAAAGGVFAIFSMTMIRLKLQRLMVRDIAALKQVNRKKFVGGNKKNCIFPAPFLTLEPLSRTFRQNREFSLNVLILVLALLADQTGCN